MSNSAICNIYKEKLRPNGTYFHLVSLWSLTLPLYTPISFPLRFKKKDGLKSKSNGDNFIGLLKLM